MGKYVVKRVLLAILTIFVISLITFFAMNAIPGGPFNSEKATSEATKAALEARYNLDKPVIVQYGLYMKNLLQGDLGVRVCPKFCVNSISWCKTEQNSIRRQRPCPVPP